MLPGLFDLCFFILYVHQCGISIVEGFEGPGSQQVYWNEFPYSAAFINTQVDGDRASQYFCGGTVITNKHVLTSAHCLDGEDLSDIEVLIGHYDLLSHLMEPCDITRYLSYRSWAKSRGIDSWIDLAVVTILVSDVSSIKAIPFSPIKAPFLKRLPVGMAAWGLSTNNIIPNIMEKAYAQILPVAECLDIVARYNSSEITREVELYELMCTSGNPRVLGTCGNSGSPVFDRENKHLIGIHYGVCPKVLPDYPEEANLFVPVGPFRKFIIEATNE